MKNIDYETINWLEGWEERDEYDPNPHFFRLSVIYQNLDPLEREMLGSNDNHLSDAVNEFNDYFIKFMDKFGHLSDNGNDFSYISWKETPAVIYQIISGFAGISHSDHSAINQSDFSKLNTNGVFEKQAIKWSRYREQISFLYTYGVSFFRRIYQQIGLYFLEMEWLNDVEDIYYLEHKEIVSAIENYESDVSIKELVTKRKLEYLQFEDVNPPPVIFGDELPPISDDETLTLSGIPASRGVFRGLVQVIRGNNDFSKIIKDCVLVIPYSDVSWTPLFALAGAVVAESGGLLSHSSIIAREYGLPAIVSVSNVTQLEDGIEVTVNGFTGDITLHDSVLLKKKK